MVLYQINIFPELVIYDFICYFSYECISYDGSNVYKFQRNIVAIVIPTIETRIVMVCIVLPFICIDKKNPRLQS